MPTITDWLMVIITAIYVIATIAICLANIKAANASKDQLNEMRKQYEEENRPFIEIEFCYEHRAWYIVRFVNHGKQTAKHVKIALNPEFIDSLPEEGFKRTLESQKEKECIIGVGQHYDLYIGSNKMRGNPNMKPVEGLVSYEGRQAEFSEEIFIDLKNYMTIFSSTSEEENLVETVKKLSLELKGIRQTLQRLQEHDKGETSNE